MLMRKLLFGAGVLVLTLTGCANQQLCDSSKADPSMLEKLNCDLGGGYRSQIQSNEQRLLDARAENKMFREVYENLEAQRQAVSQDLKAQQQQQKKLQGSLNQLLSQLKTRHASKADTQTQIQALDAQAKKLQSVNSDDPAVIAVRQQEIDELKRTISRLELSLGF